jgi:hypothetical protein
MLMTLAQFRPAIGYLCKVGQRLRNWQNRVS